MSRSSFAEFLCCTAIGLTLKPGSSRPAAALFCTVSSTWTSGCRAKERSGARTSTRCSNGTSWWSRAWRLSSRTRVSSSLKEGLPLRSVRRTNVLTKKPTSSSRALSVRPATAVPIGMSSPAPSRDSSTANAVCTTMNMLVPPARQTAANFSWTSAGIFSGIVWPRCEATGGRAWSMGRASSCGAPASICRQYDTCRDSRLCGSFSSPSNSRCHRV